jgi:hypothetical protein
MGNMSANLGSSRLLLVAPSTYFGWMKDLVTLHTSSAFVPAFIICMAHDYLFALQWFVLAIVLFFWFAIVMTHTLVVHKSFIGILYPIHLFVFRPFLDFISLSIAIMTWNARKWSKLKPTFYMRYSPKNDRFRTTLCSNK